MYVSVIVSYYWVPENVMRSLKATSKKFTSKFCDEKSYRSDFYLQDVNKIYENIFKNSNKK